MTQGKGGGPKTKEGKARVSKNAVKHAVYYFNPVLIEELETQEEWDEFCDGIVESLAPVGTLEEDLAETIALIRWRLRRVTRYETAVINHRVQGISDGLAFEDAYAARTLSKGDLPAPEPERLAGYQEKAVIPSEDEINHITRYEAHLHRLWIQNYREYEAIQARRRGERTNLARVDVSVAPRGTAPPPPPKVPDLIEELKR